MRVKIPISGFVMIAGRVSTCEQVTSFLQLQMCPLDPGTVRKNPGKGKKRKNEDFWLIFCHVGGLLSLNGIPVLVERILLWAGSHCTQSPTQPDFVHLVVQRCCEGQFLHWKVWRPNKQGWQVAKKTSKKRKSERESDSFINFCITDAELRHRKIKCVILICTKFAFHYSDSINGPWSGYILHLHSLFISPMMLKCFSVSEYQAQNDFSKITEEIDAIEPTFPRSHFSASVTRNPVTLPWAGALCT